MPIIANFLSGGSGGVELSPVENIQTLTASEKVYIKWTDPNDIIVNDVSISEWGGTLLIRKAGSAPTNRRDGIIVMDSTVHNAYSDTYFCDSGLSNGVTYYYQLFPYSKSHTYTDSDECKFNVIPNAIAPNDVSNIEATFGSNKIRLTWTDPSDTIIDGVTVSKWAGTKVVYKTGGYPTDIDDGTLAVNNTTRNHYQNTTFEIDGLENGVVYYIAFFPYSACGAVNMNEVNRVTSIPHYTAISVPTVSRTLRYNETLQSPEWSNFDALKMTVGGITSATNAGRYEATFTPHEDYCWSDGTTETKIVVWEIERKTVSSVPSQSGAVIYNGNQQSPVWSGYSSVELEISGTTAEINAGTYTAVFTPTSNYQWSDGSISGRNINWNISKAAGNFTLSSSSVVLRNSSPTANITVVRAGDGAISAVSNDTSYITVSVSGTTITVNNVNKKHGVATVTVSVGEGTNHTAAVNQVITVTCTFPTISTVPSQSGALTYTGSAQSPSWSNYDSNILTLGGTTSGTNAGTYTAKFTPKGDYSWSDGSVTTKAVTWTIGKASGSLSVNPTSLTLNSSATSGTITVTRAGDGAVSAVSSDTNIATVSVSGTTVTVNSVNNTSGSATITISVAAGTNHTAPTGKTVAVTAEFMPAKTTLNNTSWADISKVSQAGLAPSYWAVGDRKAVFLTGRAGELYLNDTYYVYIIGFDHNGATNTITFGTFKSAATGGYNICLVDEKYASKDTAVSMFFHVNVASKIIGGWKGCSLRYYILGSTNTNNGDAGTTTATTPVSNSLMSTIPADLRAVMKPMTVYTDNVGDSSTNQSDNVTATIDYLPLLAEYEVFGQTTRSNYIERNYQQQYSYFAMGNSKAKYKHTNTTSGAQWWLRSLNYNSINCFCCVNANGEAHYGDAMYSFGIAPIFRV